MSPAIFALRLSLRGVLALPDRLVLRRFGPPARNTRGVTVERDLHVMARLQEALFGEITKGEPAEARRAMRRNMAIIAGPPVAVPTRDERVAGVPCRRYGDRGNRLLVYLHGGGWVQGDLETHDSLCRRLATEGGWDVLAVDYRCAPEHPFPGPLEDVLAVVRASRGPRLALGGDSAGGNLTAAACVALRDAGEELPSLQLLIYPTVDQRRLDASHREFAHGFFLTAADIDWFQRYYGFSDPLDPRVSPLLASAPGLPPAIVTTAGFDPLRDEGEAYVAHLRAGGVPVTWLDEATLVHGYAQMDGVIPACDAAVARLMAVLRAA